MCGIMMRFEQKMIIVNSVKEYTRRPLGKQHHGVGRVPKIILYLRRLIEPAMIGGLVHIAMITLTG